MGMYHPISVATISERENNPNGGEIALLVAALLSKYVKPVSSYTELCSGFFAVFNLVDCDHNGAPELKMRLRKTGSFHPQTIDLWLALDPEGERAAINLYEQLGDFDNKGKFGFPARVMPCGFTIPDVPGSEVWGFTRNYRIWREYICNQVEPWKIRIANAQSRYS